MPRRNQSIKLEPPGAGLPWWERAFLNAAFKVGCALMSSRRAQQMFQNECELLFRITNEDESYDVFSRVLVPRLMGLEDSSRNWSVMMVLEHLCMTNSDMMTAIGALAKGIVPRGEVDTALYKPDPECDFKTLERYQEIKLDFLNLIDDLLLRGQSLKTYETYAHPWFGQLNAHQWLCLTAVHQRIHRRQAQKIIAILGVT